MFFSWQENLMGKKTVLYGVQADGGLPLRRFGTGALQGVLTVGLDLLLARHDFGPSVIFLSFSVRQIVWQRGCTSSPDFLYFAQQAKDSSRLRYTRLRGKMQRTASIAPLFAINGSLNVVRFLSALLRGQVSKRNIYFICLYW